jgi:4-amino-4-deoxy-L-arabinose transferase-like glycosyltransferase
MERKKTTLVLAIIIVLATFLRFWHLDKAPIDLFGDEVDTGYNAYSILLTGKDVTGHFLPVYLKTFIDTKSSLLAYLATVPVYFLGLNEISIRLIPALSGVMIVLLVFFIVWELFKKEVMALIAAFLTAVTPWAIHFSRGAFEANLMVFLLLWAIYFYLRSFKNNKLLIFSAIFLSLSFYAYHAAKVLVPLIIFALLFFFKNSFKKISKKKIAFSTIVFFLISLPVFHASILGTGQERFFKVSLLTDQGIIDSIILKRQGDVESSFSSRFFHNKGEAYLREFLANYLESFSPQFLFLYGDPNFRHSVSEMGEVYLVCLPFFLIGAFLFFKKGRRQHQFLLYCLFIAPLPAAITKDGGQHAIRLLLMMPIILIISAYGLYQFFLWATKLSHKKMALFLSSGLAVVFLLNFSFYLHQYFVHWSKESWRYWAYNYKEAILAVKEREKDYETVLINNSYEPSIIWFLFWMEYDPRELLKADIQNRFEENIFPGANGFRLGKYFFIKPADEEWKYNGLQQVFKTHQQVLCLASARDDTAGDKDLREVPLEGTKLLKTITSPYNQPIFYLLTKDDTLKAK